jgi:hypothetical protein
MTEYPAGHVELRGGVKQDVRVDDRGVWRASMGDSEYNGATKDALRERLLRATARKAVKVAVPFTILKSSYGYGRGKTVLRGTATGLHGRTSNILVTWETGAKEALSGYSVTALERMSTAEEGKWLALNDARAKAAKALDNFEATRRLNLRQAVTDAIEAAATEALKQEGE